MRPTVLAVVAAAAVLIADAFRLAPRRDGRDDLECAWQRDAALLASPETVVTVEPPRGAARFLRETIGHAPVPALVTFQLGDQGGPAARHWAAIVRDGGEWAAGAIAASVAVTRVDRP